jgi:hypothetical protein
MIFGRNFRMMQLLKVAPPAKSAVSIDGGEFSNEKFGELCEELAFVSILRNQENFTNAFKGR